MRVWFVGVRALVCPSMRDSFNKLLLLLLVLLLLLAQIEFQLELQFP